jgi:hypothetical protein
MFLSFARTVKQFSPERKALVKAELAQYIMEQELAHLHETNEVISSRRETPSPAHTETYLDELA